MYTKDEVTLCVLKPDAKLRGLVDSIINDIHEHGFETINFAEKKLSVEDVCVLYYESKEQPYFIDLLEYMTSGNCVYFLVRAKDAVNRLNDFVGKTDPSKSGENTLRRKYGISILKNTIHSSNANRLYFEIKQLYGVDDADNLINFPEYFRLTDGTICHTVSENCQEEGKIIGIPKYFRINVPERDSRIINGYQYARNNSIEESILYAKLFTHTKVGKVNRFGEDLCLFDLNDIERVYNPFDKAKELYDYDGDEKILNDARLIINIMINDLGISLEDIGIEGSILIEGYQEGSDIDIVVKGKSVENLKKNFHLLRENNHIKLYDESSLSLIFSRRKKYASFDTLEEMLKQERNRTVGLINGRRFWMQPILGSNYLEMQSNRRLHKLGVYCSLADVVDSSKSFLWPSYYKLKNNSDGLLKVECYDPVYMNQACVGDKVYVNAPIYIDLDTEEKILIFAPWVKETQVFKKVKI